MRLLLIAPLAAVLLLPGAARASCAMPGAFVSPESGSSLPRNPTLYVFAPGSAEGATFAVLDGGGRPVQHVASVVGSVPAFSAWRISVTARSGELAVEMHRPRDEGRPLRARYRIERRKPRRPSVPVETLDGGSENFWWMCSHQTTRNLTPSLAAPAYRVEWAASEEEWRAGKRESFVVPYRMDRFSHIRPGRWEAPSEGQVELGHVNCQGNTFEWKNAPIWVGLVALHADGNEDPPARSPVRVDPPDTRLRSRMRW